jgi:hypothetical protein
MHRTRLLGPKAFGSALAVLCLALAPAWALAQSANAPPARYAPPQTTSATGNKVVVKSIDSKGNVTYSDRVLNPAQAVKQFEIRPTGQVKRIAEATPEEPKESRPARDPKSDNEAADKFAANENAKIKKENCDTTRQNLVVLERGGRIVAVNDKGEPGYMTDAQIAAKRERVKQDIEKFCR